LEEPPPYAVFVLICHDRARLLPTIESRLQMVRFRRLSAAAVRAGAGEWAILPEEELDLVVRASLGNPERARRLAGSEEARARRRRILDLASAPVRTRDFDAAVAAAEVGAAARARGDEAEAEVTARRDAVLARLGDDKGAQRERRRVERLHDDLARRRRRRAETDELREAVDVVTSYWRDVLCVAVGAEDAVVSSDRLVELREVARRVGPSGAEGAVAAARDVRRYLELPVIPSLALEGLFHAIGLSAGEASHRERA
jgi:DNA polymerase-3 subunit delta'